MLDHGDDQIAFAHFIESRETKRKGDLDRISRRGRQYADEGLSDIVAFELSCLQEFFELKSSKILWQFNRLIDLCIFFVYHAGFMARKT